MGAQERIIIPEKTAAEKYDFKLAIVNASITFRFLTCLFMNHEGGQQGCLRNLGWMPVFSVSGIVLN
ncbi:protein of unknown function [Agrobacterium pusense]|uniref:Uncharacterized protein n=1 Tax=Agrobacterium pusense TaxID=648995 RepID=U4PSX4_9HYPH|nr:protein of unknown function [Agrobacterium pusense]